MAAKRTLKEATAAASAAAVATAERDEARPANVVAFPGPPPASSEAPGATGERAWSDAPHDAPPAPEVRQRIKAIAKGEEAVEWPPRDASPAWLSGREEALNGGPVGFNPHDEGTPEHDEWVKGWEATQPELARDEQPASSADADEGAAPKQHPEGHFDLFQGIPGKEDFADDDVEFIDAPALARIGGELIERCEEFKHLRGVDIRYFWKARGGTRARAGRPRPAAAAAMKTTTPRRMT